MCVCQAGGARYVLCVRVCVCVCVRGGAGRGDSCLDSERRSRGFVVHRTLRPLERGVVLLGVCSVCVCVCVRIVQGVSIIVLMRRRGWC